MDNLEPPSVPGNVPEFSVSEISFALKRQLEGAFPRVRVRGEISQPSFPRSGHCYFRLKDENAVLDGVYCHCNCSRTVGHRSLLSCFESDHGAYCDICMGEAQLAARLAAQGKTLQQVRRAIDRQFGS